MLLYEKLQEFHKELQRLQRDNELTSEYAKGQLLEYLNELMERKETQIIKDLSGDLESIKEGLQKGLSEYAKKLFVDNKAELIAQLANNLSDSLQEVIQEPITQNLKEALAQRLENDSSTIISEYLQELIQKPNTLINEYLSESVKSQAPELIQERIKHIDFSFLSQQPESFYEIIIDNMGKFLQKKCEEKYLQEYFLEMGKNIYKDIVEVKDLQETHFLAQMHYANSVALNELKTFNDVLRECQKAELENQKIQSQLKQEQLKTQLENQKLENAILLAQKRKAALQANKEETKHKAYKVI